MQKQIIVIGASRGIGAAVAKHFAEQGHVLISVSRTKPAAGEWIQADISTPEGINKVASKINKSPVDALLFMGGVWEDRAFTEEYDFFESPDYETRYVIAVNTIAPIELMKRLAKNLSQAHNPRAVFIFPLQEDSRFTDEMNCSRSLDIHRFRDIIGLVNDLLGLWRHKA
ncbi:MAG: SDR family oxidoreductase [Microcystis aeruginosa G11-01]|nr:SDR family oxidoreductase [Microcystis aeruginosa G11-01]